MRKIYILPNLFTSASLILGVLAIFTILDGGGDIAHVQQAIKYIIFAGFLDAMDGKVARLTNTQSLFGLNYDSLADLISFGVAPSVIIYAFIGKYGVSVARGAACLYVLCVALRLARYNVQANQEEKQVFVGLPSPAGAAVVLSFNLFVIANMGNETLSLILKTAFPFMVVITAYLMVSSVHFMGPKSVEFKKKSPFQLMFIVFVAFAIIVALKERFNLMIFPIVFSYTSFFVGKFLWRRSKALLQKA